VNQINRLPTGGRVDRNKPLSFLFDGQQYLGCAGDTVASALLANGVSIVGRSSKYSRPRGIVAAGVEEPNALMQLGTGATTTPNVIATQAELFEGLVAKPTNGWPSAKYDLSSVIGAFAPLLPPGFYNKTFMWPAKGWKFYEKFIRQMAGFGRSPTTADPDCYDKLNHHCDVLVIGGGPAGLAAATTAADSGARVIIVDEQCEIGGSLLYSTEHIEGLPALRWVVETEAALAARDNVTILTRTTAFGYYDHNFVAAMERRTDHFRPVPVSTTATGSRQRLHRIRARQVILATGALERIPVFANNDRPGVMLASSVSTYINRYAVAPGKRMVLFACADAAYQTALDWLNAGREVVAVIDPRVPDAGDNNIIGEKAQAVRDRQIEIISGSAIIDVKGRRRVNGAIVAPVSRDFKTVCGSAKIFSCDLIAASSGWSPVIHLSCHTGSKPTWNVEKQAFLPPSRKGSLTAGSINATYNLDACLNEGYRAGFDAATATGFSITKPKSLITHPTHETPPAKIFVVPHERIVTRAPKQFVDFQNDVTAAAIHIATIEGYESIEHVKRYTALGFGTDQGKLGNVNGVAVLANALGKDISGTGTTIFRPAYTPVTFGAIAGRDIGDLLDPVRQTPMHQWHEKNGAIWENVGQWKRPWFYPQGKESMRQAVKRECQAVRNDVGILDASTLGKIDIQGPDAGKFLDRIYTNRLSNLSVGSCRYTMMLKEDGMVFDDGVVARLAKNHYVATTTTGGAAEVLQWMELWLQTEWPTLKVYLTSVTDHWATIAVAGPKSRLVLAKLCDDVELDGDQFKFMHWRLGQVAGVSARIMRISFTGELSFEINVPADCAQFIWQECMIAGAEFGITPYGTETMHVLRAEKGFVIVGQDTDGSVTPFDLGMSWIVNNRKPFSFLGKRSLSRSDTNRKDRKQWIGLQPTDPEAKLPEGGQLVDDATQPLPMKMLGHVTSSYYSPTLNCTIALGFVTNGFNRMGDTVYCPLADGKVVAAKIVSSVFFDSDSERQNV
jgi:sarcosine oxidase subunit alpha